MTMYDDAHLPLAARDNEHLHRPSLRRTSISSSLHLCLVYVSWAMAQPPFTQLILQRACADHGIDSDDCHAEVGGAKVPGYDAAQQASAKFMGIYMVASGVLQIVTCAFYGVLGDAFGRRLPLTFPLIGQFLSNLAIAIVPASRQHDILLLLVFFCASFGGTFVNNAAAMASLADVTQHVSTKRRSSIFSLVEAMLWLGLLIGPALGGAVATMVGNQTCFYIIASVSFLNLLITLFTYRETLEKDRRHRFHWHRANPFASVAVFCHTKTVAVLGVTFFIGLLSGQGGVAVTGLYATKVADFDAFQLGIQGSVGLGSNCIGLVFMMPLLVNCLGLVGILRISLLNVAVIWFIWSIVQNTWEIFFVSSCAILTAIIYPVVRIGMVDTFGRHKYGEALAAVGTMEQTTSMLAPLIFQNIYRVTEVTEVHLGSLTIRCLALLVASGCAVVALFTSILLPDLPRNCDWEKGDGDG